MTLWHHASKRWLKAGLAGRERLLEMLFPPSCAACHAPIAQGGPAQFCDDCLELFDEFRPPFCAGCGASVPVDLPEGHTCGHCHGERRRYNHAVALGPYEGLLRDLLLRAKRPQGEIVALALAERLVELHGNELREREIDVVCPVPMHWRRRIRRMANCPTTIADVVARRLQVPLAAGLLRRRRATRPQTSLAPSGRDQNVRRAFALGAGYQLQSAHVLLVDDILTTGATCNAAARTLRRAGAKSVTLAVIGRSYSGR
ncbi:ComF family protein [Aeoliella mucimassa]|uniref:DNA utilization protein GntX n=1 Tax=Aeoliella mucimassa TaxID=2527972 RepID=A0A518ASP8_9BACT|nr:ComF family protein [Aeoliella mucimassa]QDU57741.1 DNA utilization protein GntX [Aeoliella mucimassa]